MSNTVYPDFPGVTWPVVKRPMHKTGIKETPSGREFRTRYMTYPRYAIRLNYEWLSEAEMRQLIGMFNTHGGAFESFLFDDRDDRAVSNQVFGVGDDSTTSFQLVRTLGGFVEPVYEFNGAPQVYRSGDWQGQQLLYSTARTNYLLRSEEMDNAAWAKTNLEVTSTNNAAPDGTSTVERLQINTASSATHTLVQNTPGLQAGTPQAGFIHARPDQIRYIRLHISERTSPSTNHCRAEFDLLTGAITNVFNIGEAAGAAASVLGPFADGSYRCIVSGTPRVGSTQDSRFEVYTIPSPGSTAIYAGTIGDGCYAWGAQQSAVLGAYIKTTSAAVTVTDYTINATGLVMLPAALPSGAQLQWTGNYYWRVRFLDDAKDFEEFLRKLWKGRVDLKTCKP